MKQKRILWVDDEIELLRSHIIFLSEKGYEEDTLMDEAIGGKIDDYLTKPVNPSQILLVCKKILEGRKISGQYAAKDYLNDFNKISRQLLMNPDYDEWIDIYLKLTGWDVELDTHPGLGLRQTLNDQKKEANKEFSKFVEKNYPDWIALKNDEYRPRLSPEIAENFLFDFLRKENKTVFFFVIDCLRLDQWLIMEKHLNELFKIDKQYYYSILPTATPYARNSLFSGLFPSEI